MSTNYTKLFSSLITSTIWSASHPTRVVWVTMLALADKNGEVHATIPGLARMANVTIPECEEAVNQFLAPDPYSRTPDDEGRRIEPIEGGWALINHGKYRLMASKEDEKKANLERQRRFRERNARTVTRNAKAVTCNAEDTSNNATVTQGRDIAEAEADTEFELATPTIPSTRVVPSEIYAAYPRKVAKAEAIKAITVAIKALNAKHADPAAYLMDRVTAYADAVATWPVDRRQFIPHPATWIRQGRYEDDPAQWRGESTKPRTWQPDPTDPEAF